MIKDTIHTTELDTAYARGVEMLQKRKYAKALTFSTTTTTATRSWRICRWITTSGRWSYWSDAQGCRRGVSESHCLLAVGRKEEGREHFLEACRLDERMEYRGNLDPEIAELLKQ